MAQTDPDMWHPEKSHGSTYVTVVGDRESTAKSICRRCPVQPECLDHALTHREEYGIWGGMSPNERVQARKARRSA